MRALLCTRYGTPDDLVIETMPDPQPGPTELLVEVRAAGINFPDVLAIAGQYQVRTQPPFVPGNEAAGVVVATGDKVQRYRPGDAVMLMPEGGAFAERCVVDQALALPMIDGLTFEQAAGFTITYGTSFHALRQSARLQPGETVLVLGAAGGVGTTAVELAKAMGARVIAAAATDAKLDFAQAAGADERINYTTEDLRTRIKKLTNERGVDVVYDPVGGELADAALRSLAWHGRYLVIGFASGTIPSFPANIALLKEASIIGVWWGTWARRNPAEQIENVKAMAALIDEGILQPRISQSFPLSEYRQAFRSITERRALGKVVLTFD